jgi:hypothetical protein
VLIGYFHLLVFSQDSSRDFESNNIRPSASFQERYLENPNVENRVISKKEYKKSYLYWFYNHHEKLREDFYKRRKKVLKKYQRQNRLMEKPQYSDPSYFGHKRKPKIRERGKRKFCKECGIVH